MVDRYAREQAWAPAYVADLLRRLGATNRAQAALLARERGWV